MRSVFYFLAKNEGQSKPRLIGGSRDERETKRIFLNDYLASEDTLAIAKIPLSQKSHGNPLVSVGFFLLFVLYYIYERNY